MNGALTEKQKRVGYEGKIGEKTVVKWLKARGFAIEEWHPEAHTGYYDIKARKGTEKWIIEVKTGENPQINIENFLKMVQLKGYNIGLALVAKDHEVHLLEIKKTRLAALKAWKTRKRKSS